MIEISELSAKLQSILNGTDPLSPSSRPDSVTFFDVRTPSAPYSDKTAFSDKKTYFPVMVTSGGQGNYQPIPDVMLFSCSMSITFIYPVSSTEAVRRYFDYLAKALNGRMVDFGTVSGNCVCALGTPSIGQLQYIEEAQFQAFRAETSKIFGTVANVSRAWSTMTCEIYFSGGDRAGGTDGLIFGNQATDTISFGYEMINYSEDLLLVSPSSAKQSATYEQQGLSSLMQRSLETNTAYGKAFVVLVRANSFWLKIMTLYESGALQGVSFLLTHKIRVAGTDWLTGGAFSGQCVMKDVSFSCELGKPISCSFSLVLKSTVGSL